MAVAHDAMTRWPASGTDVTSGSRTITHTPSGTPKGVVVMIGCQSNASPVTGVLYGGVRMLLVGEADDTSEVGTTLIFVLAGRDVPTGAQTVTFEGCTTAAKWASIVTVTASTSHTRIESVTVTNTSTAANPSVTMAGLSVGTLSYGIVHTGAAAPSATPIAGTTLLQSQDYGALAAQTFRSTNAITVAGTNHQIGVTLASEDYCIVGVSIMEWTPRASGADIAEQTPQAGMPFFTSGTGFVLQLSNMEVQAGADRVLVVKVCGEGDGAGSITVDTVTWGSNNLVLAERATRSDWSWSEIWHLVNPPQGLETVTIVAESGGVGVSDQMAMHVNVLFGVDQTTPLRDSDNTTGNSTSSSLSLAGVQSTDYLFDCLTIDGTGIGVTQGADQTYLFAPTMAGFQGAYSRQTPGGDGVMSWTWTGGTHPFSYTAVAYMKTGTGGGGTKGPPLLRSRRPYNGLVMRGRR